MSILCLWDIQLTFDWVRIELHGAYPRKSELNSCKDVQEFLRSDIFCGSNHDFRSGKVNANREWCVVPDMVVRKVMGQLWD